MHCVRLTSFAMLLLPAFVAGACAPTRTATTDSMAARDPASVAAPVASAPMPNVVPESGGAIPVTPGTPAVRMPNARPGRPVPGAPTSAAPASHAAVDSLERIARALAHTDGCGSATDCRMAPVGVRACGGPRTFIPYCRLTTDSAALFRALAALARAEAAYNARSGMASTCEMRLAPAPTIEAGRCGPSSGRGGAGALPVEPAKLRVP